jgi:hypothetical protein
LEKNMMEFLTVLLNLEWSIWFVAVYHNPLHTTNELDHNRAPALNPPQLKRLAHS